MSNPSDLSHHAITVHRLLSRLSLDSVKDYIQIGVGLSFISGGIITVLTLFGGGGGDSPPAAVAPTSTPAATATLAPAPTETPSLTGEFLRVQFGTQQDPATSLPAGDTVGPDDDLTACPGDTLYAWVEHSFHDGDVITGRISSRAGTLFSSSVPVDERAPNFWIGVQLSDTGIHTLTVTLDGTDVTKSWSVNVICG